MIQGGDHEHRPTQFYQELELLCLSSLLRVFDKVSYILFILSVRETWCEEKKVLFGTATYV